MGIRPEDIDDEPEFMAKHTDCQLDTQVDVSEMMALRSTCTWSTRATR